MGMKKKTFACNVSKLITYYVANYRDLNKCISNALNRTCKLSTAVCSCISPLLQCTRTNQHHCSVLMHTNNTAVYSYIPAARRGNGGCEHPTPQLRAWPQRRRTVRWRDYAYRAHCRRAARCPSSNHSTAPTD